MCSPATRTTNATYTILNTTTAAWKTCHSRSWRCICCDDPPQKNIRHRAKISYNTYKIMFGTGLVL